MFEDFYNITKIRFGVLSTKDIRALSVCEVTNTKMEGKNSIYDNRMGPLNDSIKCPTCNQEAVYCAGHFGHLQLAYPVINPVFLKYVIIFLKCFCDNCFRLLLTKQYIDVMYGDIHKNKIFSEIHKKCETIKVCNRCKRQQSSYNVNNDEKIISTFEKKNKTSIIEEMTSEIIFFKFNEILDEDIKLMNLDPDHMHPRNMIIKLFPIIPPCTRPYVMSDDSYCDDDITTRYQEIIKINESLKKNKNKYNLKPNDDLKKEKIRLMFNLRFKIKTLIDNTNSKIKNHSNRIIRSIKHRITGKDALIRGNVMAKRVEESARTVIGPDPTLHLDQVVVPEKIANVLTLPKYVNMHNIQMLEKIVNDRRAEKIVRDDGSIVYIKYIPPHRYIKLKTGYIVHRYLRDGDYVTINRQPTLHRGSFMGYKAVIRPQKTIAFGLASTKSFNADYDGDEMNLHAPQSLMVSSEFENLMAAHNQIINPKSSNPNISIVQDSIIGSYLMTLFDDLCDRDEFFQIMMNTNVSLDAMFKKLEIIKHHDMNMYGGRAIVSMLLPSTFCLETKDVFINDGIYLRGLLTKSIINNKLIKYLNKEYGNRAAVDFIDNIQFVSGKWLEGYGFSIGIKDCIASAYDKIDEVVNTNLSEAYLYEQNTIDPVVKEIKINGCLSRAKDIGMKLASEALDEDNNLVRCVKSGSKGDMFNIAQVVGIIGQQNIDGERIAPELSRGTRTLPHYHFTPQTDLERYESRGFVKNSFFKGMNPREFFFHMTTGRSGVTDTAVKVASSGYNGRKLRNLTKDLVVQYDGTVRDIRGNVIQFVYGGTGLDAEKCIVIDSKMRPFDIRRIANKYK